jgi:hypothetical protein
MMVVQQFRDGTLLSRPARECFKNSFLNILLLTRCLPEPNRQIRQIQEMPIKYGAPDTIRTCDLCLRRATLYPAELRVRYRFI